MKLKAPSMVVAGLVFATAIVAPTVRAEAGPLIGQPAPEITGGPWINSQPLSMAGLRGRVVVVEFWTYG